MLSAEALAKRNLSVASVAYDHVVFTDESDAVVFHALSSKTFGLDTYRHGKVVSWRDKAAVERVWA